MRVARRPLLSLFTHHALCNWAFLSRYSRSRDYVAVCPGTVARRSSLALHVAVRPVAAWVFLSRLHVAVRPVAAWAFLSRLHVAVRPVAGRSSLVFT